MALAAPHAPTAGLLSLLDGDASLRALHEDDRPHDKEHRGEEEQGGDRRQEVERLGVDGAEEERGREDEQRDD